MALLTERTSRRAGPEHHHRDVTGGAARAAVFGVSDGLLTNISLILGVAGASPGAGVVRLAGLAGLIAGAFSMGAGEYISMSAQSELMQRELEIERTEIARHPESERRELAGLYIQRGVRREVADEVATTLMSDPETALEVHGREELGFDPRSTGSPLQAATSSLGSFAVGAVVPLVPWFFTQGRTAVIISVVLGALMAGTIGLGIGYFTGRPAWRTVLRQLALTVVAAGVTYGAGAAIGVRVS